MLASRRWAEGLVVAVDVLWWLSVAAVVIGAALLVVVATHATGGGALTLPFYFKLPSSAYHISSAQLGGAAAKVGVSNGQLAFARPRVLFVLVAAVILALAAGGWLFILHQLRRLLATIRSGETFAHQNALRLRRIGLAVIAFEVAHSFAVWSGGLYLEHALAARGLRPRSHFGVDVAVLLLGVLLLALASAFRVGSEIAREQALTV
ncbi:MAG: DUF2975 domain-containing protein [Solirubrobacteraceae bacterium]